MSQSEILKI